MSEKYLYLPQIQPDWQISLSCDKPSTSTPETVQLKGNLGKTIDISLPPPLDTTVPSFWLNILRLEQSGSPEVLPTTVTVETDTDKHYILTSPAVDVEHRPDDNSIHMTRTKDGRILIDSIVYPPVFHHQHIHPGRSLLIEPIQSNRALETMKLLPGDLDSDDDDIIPRTANQASNQHDSTSQTSDDEVKRYNDRILARTVLDDPTKVVRKQQELPSVNTISINHKNQVLTGDEYGNLQLWDSSTGIVTHTMGKQVKDEVKGTVKPIQQIPLQHRPHIGAISHVVWFSNDILFLSASTDTTLKLWSTEYPTISLRTYIGHQRRIVDVTIVEHLQQFLTIGLDGYLIKWASANTTPQQRVHLLEAVPKGKRQPTAFQSLDDKVLTSLSVNILSHGYIYSQSHPRGLTPLQLIAATGPPLIAVTHTYGVDIVDYDSMEVLTTIAPQSSPSLSACTWLSHSLLLVGSQDGFLSLYNIHVNDNRTVQHQLAVAFHVAEDQIHSIRFNNNQLYFSTFQGDLVTFTHPLLSAYIQHAISYPNGDSTQAPPCTTTAPDANSAVSEGFYPTIFSGTDQPIRQFGFTTDSHIIAVGDDGVYGWKAPQHNH